MKFKKGDKVRILSRATMVGVEREEVGKVGEVTSVGDYSNERFGILVRMNKICKAKGMIPTWSVGYGMIKLVPRENEQLVFDFMVQ